MAKPDYATLLGQIAQEANTEIRDALIEECYVFDEPLTDEEKQLFSYVFDGYVEDNPGYDDANTFVSYVGKYFSLEGDETGE